MFFSLVLFQYLLLRHFSQCFKSLPLIILESFSSCPPAPGKGGSEEHKSAGEGTALLSPGFLSQINSRYFFSKIMFKILNNVKKKKAFIVKYRYRLYFKTILMTAAFLSNSKQTNKHTKKNPPRKTTNNGTWKVIHSCSYRKPILFITLKELLFCLKIASTERAKHQGMILKRSSRIKLKSV